MLDMKQTILSHGSYISIILIQLHNCFKTKLLFHCTLCPPNAAYRCLQQAYLTCIKVKEG